MAMSHDGAHEVESKLVAEQDSSPIEKDRISILTVPVGRETIWHKLLVVDLASRRLVLRCGIVDSRVLVALDGLSVFVLEFQELDVDLNLVARHLLLISLGVDIADTCAARQPAEAIAPENAIDPGVGNGDGVIARQILDDADWPQPASLAQM